jgi:hypothetical protein
MANDEVSSFARASCTWISECFFFQMTSLNASIEALDAYEKEMSDKCARGEAITPAEFRQLLRNASYRPVLEEKKRQLEWVSDHLFNSE